MLTVLQVAYALGTVSLNAVGGAEQVLAMLDRALVAGGHRSIVVACEGSRVAGILRATPRGRGLSTAASTAAAYAAHRREIARAISAWPVDVVHVHGLDFTEYVPAPGASLLVTLHLPPSWYPSSVFTLDRPDTYLHCVSESQRSTCPPSPLLLPTIPNGIPVEAMGLRWRKREFVAAVGRICPEKGFHLAIDAARRARVPMRLAGRVFPYESHRRYFDDEIAPRLDRDRRFIGIAGFRTKRRLMGRARCLLVPSLVPETSSLVAMEALACGTPVVAFPNGALTEIIDHGRTGFLVRDEVEMAEAIHECVALDPETCRAAARDRFSATRMVKSYLDLYETLAARSSAARREFAA